MEKLQRSISRREALKMLEAKGLIKIAPGYYGSVVMIPSTETVKEPLVNLIALNQVTNAELLEVRKTIELNTVRWAALRKTDEELRTMKTILDSMIDSKDKDFNNFIRLDIAFHQAVDAASHNKLACMLDEVCHQLILKLLFDMHANKNEKEKNQMKKNIIKSHTLIYQAIVEGNVELAGERMLEHHKFFSDDLILKKNCIQ
ncbi:MAG: FadR/GntR family transcriptional regulator [Sphaerochaetaceae bacterium]